MLSSAQFQKFLRGFYPIFHRLYGDSYERYPTEYTQVFNIQKSNSYQERDHTFSMFGLVPEKPRGDSVAYDEANDGYDTTYIHTTYGLGFIVERELLEDDQYRKFMQMPGALSNSNRETEETLAANHLNRAFNNSYTGGDGKELCATDHPVYGTSGSAWSNELDTAADLNAASLEQALIDISEFVSDEGLKMNARAKKLIVHPMNDWNAQKLLKSVQEPGTNNNDINPAAMGVIPEGHIVMHYLTDPDAWFIQTNVPNGLTWFWRRKPEFTRDNDFDTENAKFKTTWRAASGWSDPRGIFGSPGA